MAVTKEQKDRTSQVRIRKGTEEGAPRQCKENPYGTGWDGPEGGGQKMARFIFKVKKAVSSNVWCSKSNLLIDFTLVEGGKKVGEGGASLGGNNDKNCQYSRGRLGGKTGASERVGVLAAKSLAGTARTNELRGGWGGVIRGAQRWGGGKFSWSNQKGCRIPKKKKVVIGNQGKKRETAAFGTKRAETRLEHGRRRKGVG